MNGLRFFLTGLIVVFLSTLLSGQTTSVSGTIYDKENGETIPFVSIKFIGTNTSTVADFDGNFTITTTEKVDSLVFLFGGYKELKIGVAYGTTVSDKRIEMSTESMMLQEVVIERKENPAHGIMRKVIKHKDKNDIESLEAYQYESYSKVQMDVDHLADHWKEKKVTKKLTESLEEIEPIVDEDGNEVLTVFFSESLTDVYYRKNPESKKDYVKASRSKGLAVSDGGLTSQFVGTSMTTVNLYQNSITILDKEFISPITDNWKSYYKYYLVDTVEIDSTLCYELEIEPVREQDLAFKGHIWIAISDTSYALKKVNLVIPKEANLNFLDKVKLEINYIPTQQGPWINNFVKYTFDVGELSDKVAGMIVRSASHYSDFVINEPKDSKFYDRTIAVADDATEHSDKYWEDNRQAKFSKADSQSFAMVDTIKNLPVVKSYIDFIDIFVDGHYDLGPISLGPYTRLYAYNNIEKHRFRVGFKTNYSLMKNAVFKTYLAYGTGDQQFKYSANLKLILSKYPWTEMGFSSYSDIDQYGITDKVPEASFIQIASRWGTLKGAFWNHENKFYLYRQINKSLSQKITFRNRFMDPLFNFSYYTNSEHSRQKSSINTSEVILQTRFAKNEKIVVNDNSRISLGTGTRPVFTLTYTAGISGVLKSNFEYHKIDLQIDGKIGMGAWGRTKYWLTGGKIFGTLPYPLLNIHLGNETIFYTILGYSMMNSFEFVSDQYISLQHVHHFDGFIMNRIPFARKLNWRFVTNFAALYGSVSQENMDIIPDEEGVVKFQSFENKPYLEVGYGIENIFKFFRIQAFHRLSYLNRPYVSKVGVKMTFQVQL